MKMQAKNFDFELFRLHPNRGRGTPESFEALGNSPSRFVSQKIELKKTDRKTQGISHNIRDRASRHISR